MKPRDVTRVFHVKQQLLPLFCALVALLLVATPLEVLALPDAPEASGPWGPAWFGLAAGLPLLLLTATSFLKITIVLSLLRVAIGTPQVPSNTAVAAIAAVLSLFIMAPIGQQMVSLIDAKAASEEGLTSPVQVLVLLDSEEAGLSPFLARHCDPQDLETIESVGSRLHPNGTALERSRLLSLVPAFLLTELKEAFLIGLLLLLPFVVIDLVIANVLVSLGLHSVNPNTITLPAKLLLFVLIDGWSLLLEGLLLGYAP